MRQPVLLVDFSVYKPPEELKVDYPAVQDASKQWKVCEGFFVGQQCRQQGAAVAALM